MHRVQAEGAIARIIEQIIQECQAQGEEVSESLAAYIVKAVILDPDSDFYPDKPLSKEDIETLIKMCVARLLDSESPSLDTMKMQVFFELSHIERDEFLAEHHRVMQARLEPVMTEALEARGRTQEETEDAYRRIVSAVLLLSGLGSPTNVAVVRETTAALQSIFPQSDIVSFLKCGAAQKRNQIEQFTGIVTGIRLFNKDCLKGGAGIDDVPQLLVDGIPKTLSTLHDQLLKAREVAARNASLFMKLTAHDPSPGVLSSANATIRAAEQSGVTPDLLRAVVINARQYEAFLEVLEKELIGMTANVDRLCNIFRSQLKKLRELISDRLAIPSMEVYPRFLELSATWSKLHDELTLLSVLTSTLNTLQSFFVGRRMKWTKEKEIHLISDAEFITDDKIKPHGPIAEEPRGPFTWVYPNSASNATNLSPELEGFCVFSLLKHQGLLVKGDMSLGLLMTPDEKRLYAFSSPEAVRDFLVVSDQLLQALPTILRRLPELIQFLKLGHIFTTGIPGVQNGFFIEKPHGKVDVEMQTEVHPIESFIDKEYEWNEWELRKKALKLANLRKKATSSVQTILSNWRRDNSTQVYLLKNSSTTTKEDGYTQVPRPAVFYHGLRGCGGIDQAVNADAATRGEKDWCTLYRPTNATTVDLTIPVEKQLLGSLHKGCIRWY
ncbi:Cilia- and flagella-associated protein 206 [Clonorchis sinensis]|uniref:Cilia- and flagella-associated protein 206 n=1 Tax=Clonorchis sinensis TaxID=79923 RepID=A0A8T1MVE7_CLOSI|nr:Cilia- and flagella-associated protein 206 [Clonorchis sinensis]